MTVLLFEFGGLTKMYYKVIKNNRVIDVLDKLIFLKYQKKHDIMILCDPEEAQAILSSDSNTIWHEKTLDNLPINKYETVEVEEIDEHEYRQLLSLSLCTPMEIIENYTMSLIEEGIL